MRRVHIVLIAVLVLHLASGLYADEIGSVKVVGNIFIPEDKILSILGIHPGDEYRPEKVSRGLKRLFDTKNFSDLSAYYKVVDGKVVLTIVVEEYPRIKEIRIQGNSKIKESDIRDKLNVKVGYFARPSMIAADVQAIRDLYSEKGYSRMEGGYAGEEAISSERGRGRKGPGRGRGRVSREPESTSEEGYSGTEVSVRQIPVKGEHKVILVFDIKEGEKVKIKHIDFLGNTAIDSKRIKSEMESKESRFLRGGEYKPKVLEEDLKRIRRLYENIGYLDATASIYRVVERDGGKYVDIYIKIDEGKQYVLNSIKWTGNKVIKDEDIEKLININEGEPYSLEKIENLQIAVNGLYWDKGYIWSRIIPQRRIRKNRIDLELQIVENNPASINEIKISGNTKTFESVIRRELKVYPGDKFILQKVQRSLRDVFSLGYFNGPPKIDTEPINEKGDINLLIKVEEKQTGYFRMGAGFSQLNSLSGFLGLSEPNFLGRGKSFSLDWEFGRYRRNLNFQFSDPYFMGSRTALTISVYNWIQDRIRQQYYTDRRIGFSIQVGRPFPWLDYTRVFASYRFEKVKLYDFSIDYPETGILRRMKWPKNKSSIMFGFTRNSTDNPFHPTRGSIASLSAEFTGGPLQGNVEYMRYMGQLSWFRNLFWKFTYHLEMNAGVIDGYTSPSQVDDFERFRLGGNRRYALRGYDFYEVVPEGNDPFVGGRFMSTFTHEVLFPFSQQVYGLVFFDAGNTWNSFGEADLFNLRKSVGVGIRVEMPMLGTLGFDYGYGFDKIGGPAWEPHFTFGTFF